MPSDQIKESVHNNDLKALIDATVSLDQYKSKVGKDSEIIVMAIKCMDEEPAKDLSQFLETGHKTLDVDISPGPDQEGKYTVFIEMERDSEAFKKIDDMLEHLDYIVARVGVDHVGIGTDFNHGSGIEGFADASEALNVTTALLARGYSAEEIEKIWGGNFLRVFRETGG